MRQVPESRTLNTELTETNLGQQNTVEFMGDPPPEISMVKPNDLSNLIASMLTAIKDSNKQLQALQNKVDEINKSFQISAAAWNSQVQESVRADKAIFCSWRSVLFGAE
jgi:hypothetical protein